MIRVLACDISGTICLEDSKIPQQLKEKFSSLKDKIMISFVSTMPFEEVQNFLEKNQVGPKEGYPALICSFEQAYILQDGAYQEIVDHRPENLKILKTLRDKILEIGDHLERELLKKGINYQRNKEYKGLYDYFIFQKEEDAIFGQEKIQEWIGELPLDPWRNRIYLCLLNSQTSKVSVLKESLDKIGINPQDVLAIGDAANDREMLSGQYGFKSACVGNAEPDIKKIVQDNGGYVALKEDGLGVLDIIRHYNL